MRALPLADELFMIGYDEYSGKCHVNQAVIGCSLAGAVLSELMLAGRIALANGRMVVRDPRPYSDRVTDTTIAEMLKRPTAFPPRSWVDYLCGQARDLVAARLEAGGMIRREQARGLTLRTVVRFPAVDPVAAAGPRVRLRYLLDQGQPLDIPTAVLATLVRAAELEDVLLLKVSRQQVHDLLTRIAEALPPDLRALTAAVDAAVAAVALTVRR